MPRRNGLGIFGKGQTEGFGTFFPLDFGRVGSDGRVEGDQSVTLDEVAAGKSRGLASGKKKSEGGLGKLHGGNLFQKESLCVRVSRRQRKDEDATVVKSKRKPSKMKIYGRREALPMMR